MKNNRIRVSVESQIGFGIRWAGTKYSYALIIMFLCYEVSIHVNLLRRSYYRMGRDKLKQNGGAYSEWNQIYFYSKNDKCVCQYSVETEEITRRYYKRYENRGNLNKEESMKILKSNMKAYLHYLVNKAKLTKTVTTEAREAAKKLILMSLARKGVKVDESEIEIPENYFK